MKLTTEQVELLKWLTNHPWFTLIEQIEEEASNKLGQSILNADLWNDKHIEKLRENQIYAKARKDFLVNIKKHTMDTYTNDIKLF